MDNPGAIDNGTNASGTTQDTSAQGTWIFSIDQSESSILTNQKILKKDSGVKVCPVTGLSGECPGGS